MCALVPPKPKEETPATTCIVVRLGGCRCQLISGRKGLDWGFDERLQTGGCTYRGVGVVAQLLGEGHGGARDDEGEALPGDERVGRLEVHGLGHLFVVAGVGVGLGWRECGGWW